MNPLFCTRRELLSLTTREFAAVNEAVRGAEAALKELARPDLAAALRGVQERERAKLHFTLIQQVFMDMDTSFSSDQVPC